MVHGSTASQTLRGVAQAGKCAAARLDPRERQRATFVALHLSLTRERLGRGWFLRRRSGESRRSGGPLCQGNAHIEMPDSRLGHAL